MRAIILYAFATFAGLFACVAGYATSRAITLNLGHSGLCAAATMLAFAVTFVCLHLAQHAPRATARARTRQRLIALRNADLIARGTRRTITSLAIVILTIATAGAAQAHGTRHAYGSHSHGTRHTSRSHRA